MAESNNLDLKLTSKQDLAATTRDRDVLVTAGAGSGKTRTLVAHYMVLLKRGDSPRQIAAITFTEKAAREMRNRVRSQVSQRAKDTGSIEDQIYWQNLESQMDASRIGTIHSLCAEMIRTHPVEAQVDPDFSVLEEGQSAAMKTQAVQDTLIWATGQEEIAPLFRIFTTSRLSELLHYALDHRLELVPILSSPGGSDRGWQLAIREIKAFVECEDISQAVAALDSLDVGGRLERDAGMKFAEQVYSFLSVWREIKNALANGNLILVAQQLFQMRREHMRMNIGKKDSLAKRELLAIREAYDGCLGFWVGGAKSGDLPPGEEVEHLMEDAQLRLQTLIMHVMGSYRATLDQAYSLDFDDLESKALEILKQENIRHKWQSVLQIILVDEYQDTNERQQKIIQALCGERPGSLFVVGDARQSIYRFRGADVTVFRGMQSELKGSGGEVVELDLTFRTHPDLLRTLDEVLIPILGTEDLPDAPYHVPFSKLVSARESSREGIATPYFEILCGVGPTAEEARPAAAQILAQRLIELQAQGQIQSWDDVALLFRASTGFLPYEDALESVGIPYVTVAGRGFYDRPEIRDFMNLLRALADPEDDLAMAGLLRSPAFALSDEGLYYLRWKGLDRRSMWEALGTDLGELSDQDRESAERAYQILLSLTPLVDRLSVAELIKKLMDLTDYRAAMAAGHSRLWRNIDKLLRDAHTSRIHRVRAFLDYIQTLRDVGVREGEAPSDVEGALQLMTVHRAKGLEFEIVVLADASRAVVGRAQVAYLSPEVGFTTKPDGMEGSSLITKLAQWIDRQESDAEEKRLLYVALTRAREKVLISGHLSQARSGTGAGGWLKELLNALGIDAKSLVDRQEQWLHHKLPSGSTIAIWAGEEGGGQERLEEIEIVWPESKNESLFQPLFEPKNIQADPDVETEPVRDWRATGEHVHAPAAAIGRIVHETLRRWVSPQDPSLDDILESLALREGLVDRGQRRRAIRESRRLLERFWDDPLRIRIDRAQKRYHELPYTLSLPKGGMDIGTIDLLFLDGESWTIIDFKTDELRDEEALEEAVDEYRPQLMRYKRAVHDLLEVDNQAFICFLDAKGAVESIMIQ
jgi:ATP-dependent helicase/nuclease subunit A